MVARHESLGRPQEARRGPNQHRQPELQNAEQACHLRRRQPRATTGHPSRAQCQASQVGGQDGRKGVAGRVHIGNENAGPKNLRAQRAGAGHSRSREHPRSPARVDIGRRHGRVAVTRNVVGRRNHLAEDQHRDETAQQIPHRRDLGGGADAQSADAQETCQHAAQGGARGVGRIQSAAPATTPGIADLHHEGKSQAHERAGKHQAQGCHEVAQAHVVHVFQVRQHDSDHSRAQADAEFGSAIGQGRPAHAAGPPGSQDSAQRQAQHEQTDHARDGLAGGAEHHLKLPRPKDLETQTAGP